MSAVFRNPLDPSAAPAAIVFKRAAALLGYVKVPRSEREFAPHAGRPAGSAGADQAPSNIAHAAAPPRLHHAAAHPFA